MNYLSIFLGLIVLPMLSSCVALMEMTLPDIDLSDDRAAWGEIDRGQVYRLKSDMYLNESELNHRTIVRPYRPTYIEGREFPVHKVKVVQKGTELRFTEFIIYRGIWGSLPTVRADLLSGEIQGEGFTVVELVRFTQKESGEYMISGLNKKLVEPVSERVTLDR